MDKLGLSRYIQPAFLSRPVFEASAQVQAIDASSACNVLGIEAYPGTDGELRGEAISRQ